jgi:thiamine biosynthesis lipoprotein
VSARRAPRRQTCSGRYHPLLGTNVETRVDAAARSDDDAQRLASDAESATVDEMLRLQAVFSVFDASSELCRWRIGAINTPSPELAECLAAAEQWWKASGGAFHPAAARLRALWLAAEADQRLPGDEELADVVSGLQELPYVVDEGRVRRTGDCSGIDLNAIAKGYIVDRAVATAMRFPGVVDVLVNAGGDLRHEGDRKLRIGVEDPADRVGPPATVIELTGGAVATSGSVHRGFQIGGTWYGHVLDPRTGRPVADRPSTTVRAREAMTADAVATVVNVLGWPTAEGVVADLADVAVLSVDAAGLVLRGSGWS